MATHGSCATFMKQKVPVKMLIGQYTAFSFYAKAMTKHLVSLHNTY